MLCARIAGLKCILILLQELLLRPERRHRFSSGYPREIAEAVAVADFNGDGRPDFAGVDDNNELLVFLNTTTKDTCAFPSHIGVRICSPDSDGDSDDTARTTRIHASSNGGALPIIGMKALIDGKLVFESDVNTLDASVTVGAGRHVLTVSASDRNGNVYQSTVEFHVR